MFVSASSSRVLDWTDSVLNVGVHAREARDATTAPRRNSCKQQQKKKRYVSIIPRKQPPITGSSCVVRTPSCISRLGPHLDEFHLKYQRLPRVHLHLPLLAELGGLGFHAQSVRSPHGVHRRRNVKGLVSTCLSRVIPSCTTDTSHVDSFHSWSRVDCASPCSRIPQRGGSVRASSPRAACLRCRVNADRLSRTSLGGADA